MTDDLTRPSEPPSGDEMRLTVREFVERSENLTVRLSDAERGGARTPQTGSQLGRYRVMGQLGAGAMGEVLQVRDEQLGRDLAAKIARGEVSEFCLAKFMQEARITGQLEHPNIVPVHELGYAADGTLYFTMKQVQGRTLEQIIVAKDRAIAAGDRDAGPTLTTLLQTFGRVCDAVAFAHSRGVIHRDLKPANIMVGAFGEVMVMDWGLAKSLADPDDPVGARAGAATDPGGDPALRTLDGTVLGTPAYMPPEQARGETARLDERSDLFSLGAILYEILTLQPPFVGESTGAILDLVAHGHLVPPSERDPEHRVPWELEAVVLRAMAHEPEARYQTVAALRDDVASFTEHRTLSAARYGVLDLAYKFARRHRAAVFTAALLMLLLAATSVYYVLRVRDEAAAKDAAYRKEAAALQQARLATDAARRERDEADTAREGEARKSRELGQALAQARANLADALAFRALAAMRERNVLEAMAFVAAARREADTARSYVAGFALPPPVVTVSRRFSVAVEGAAFSPEDRLLAARFGRWVLLVSVDSGKIVRSLETSHPAVSSVAFVPGGERLVIGGTDGAVGVWDTTTEKRVVVLTGPRLGARVRGVAASVTGLIAAAYAGGRTMIWRADTRARLHNLPRTRGGAHGLAFSPGGESLATAGADGTLRIWNPRSGRPVRSLEGHAGPARCVAYSADGAWLASGGADRTVRLWRAVDGQPGRVLGGHRRGVRCVAFSRRDRRLVSGSDDGQARLWDAASGALLQTLGHQAAVRSASFAPDGRGLATVGTHLTLWSVARGRRGRTLGRGASGRALAFCGPEALATGSASGAAERWDLATGHHTTTPGRAGAEPLAFSPGGALMVCRAGPTGLVVRRTHTGRKSTALGPTSASAQLVAFSPDGKLLATAGGVALRIWRLADGSLVHREVSPSAGGVSAIAWSPTGQLVATGHRSGLVRLWRPDGPTRIETLHAHRRGTAVRAIAFGPRGTVIATGGEDTTATLWTLAPERGSQRVASLALHQSSVQAIAFSPDGRVLATGGGDHTVRLWESATGAPLAQLAGHDGAVVTAAFSKGGRLLATGAAAPGGKLQVRVWGLDVPRDLSAAQRISGIRLKDKEPAPILSEAFERLRDLVLNPGRPMWPAGD